MPLRLCLRVLRVRKRKAKEGKRRKGREGRKERKHFPCLGVKETNKERRWMGPRLWCIREILMHPA